MSSLDIAIESVQRSVSASHGVVTDMVQTQKSKNTISANGAWRRELKTLTEGAEDLAVAIQSIFQSSPIMQIVGNQLAQCHCSLSRPS